MNVLEIQWKENVHQRVCVSLHKVANSLPQSFCVQELSDVDKL